MIDAGAKTVDARTRSSWVSPPKGLFPESIERILVTHAHPDHYGLVPLICDGSVSVKAYMGERECQRIAYVKPV